MFHKVAYAYIKADWKAHHRPAHVRDHQKSSSCSFNTPPRNLSPVQAGERRRCNLFIFASLHLFLSCREDDLDVTRVTLVGVNATMGAIRAAPSFLLLRKMRFGVGVMDDEHTGACCTTIFLITRFSSSKLFASAFDSAFFKRRVINLTDFSGQRPMILHK